MNEIFIKFEGDRLLDGKILAEAEYAGTSREIADLITEAGMLDDQIAAIITSAFVFIVARMPEQDAEKMIRTVTRSIRILRNAYNLEG